MHPRIRTHLEDRLQTAVLEVRSVLGGDIHRAFRVQLDDGSSVFVKTSDTTPAGLFAAEAEGLRWLGGFDALPVPRVLAHLDGGSGGPGYLGLSWHDSARGRSDRDAEAFGRGLAALHSVGHGAPGWHRDVFIGPLPQANVARVPGATVGEAWAAFWVDRRLRPMAKRAAPNFDRGTRTLLERVCAQAPALLNGTDHIGPLHGDLWGGNVLWSDHGPMLIDPAVYIGDPEVDLAMMALFGGFSPRSWQTYFAVRPQKPGFSARQRLYQLWPLLVHVALFGASYSAQVDGTARAILAEV